MEVAAVVGLEIDTLFSTSVFKNLELGGSFEQPIELNEHENKENFPTADPVSAHPTEHPRLLRSYPFGGQITKLSEYIFRPLFE